MAFFGRTLLLCSPNGRRTVAVPPTSTLVAADLVQFIRSCYYLEAQHNPAIRSFILMRLQWTCTRMEARSLAEAAKRLAQMQLYSPELSAAVASQMFENPWSFDRDDARKLLTHFSVWRLGLVQKRAFQILGLVLSEYAEFLRPHDALEAITCFAQVGSRHEILLQHLNLNLLLDRRFTTLEPAGIAQLAASMAKTEYYHAGLLREIVCHLEEEPLLVAKWTTSELSMVLRCMGLAPVHIPAPVLRLLGCRYNSILPDMTSSDLRDFFEVSAFFPEVLRAVIRRGGSKKLMERLQTCLPQWHIRACADAVSSIVLAMDSSPHERFVGHCACMVDKRPAEKEATDFRTDQPEDQLQVVIKPVRNWKQRDMRPKEFRVGHRPSQILRNAWLVEDSDKQLMPANLALICQAPWKTIGRRSQRPQALDTRPLLEASLLQLMGGFQDTGKVFGELPGAKTLEQLLAPEDEEADAADKQLALMDEFSTSPVLAIDGPSAIVEMGPGVEFDGSAADEQDPEKLARDDLKDPPMQQEAVMRRSDLLQVAGQTLATLRLGFGPSAPISLQHMPPGCLGVLERMMPVISHLLRPRRLEDDVVAKYGLGPLRMEAFIRRPDEPMVMHVYKTVCNIMPYLPHHLGWADWEPRRQDNLNGETTGGALISFRREVEVPPFVVCLVLSPRSSLGLPGRTWDRQQALHAEAEEEVEFADELEQDSRT
eukprot:TRINITY_DN39764_c0_g1_i1.p1 TRINITY_DN39764_c0_g1~~TRINITY_DN39764_c0_g1_i1.p1  ORF type:complete len:735 (-),score=127.03 TRINITY_DN39764_c0_g1_i1:14-2146(-)